MALGQIRRSSSTCASIPEYPSDRFRRFGTYSEYLANAGSVSYQINAACMSYVVYVVCAVGMCVIAVSDVLLKHAQAHFRYKFLLPMLYWISSTPATVKYTDKSKIKHDTKLEFSLFASGIDSWRIFASNTLLLYQQQWGKEVIELLSMWLRRQRRRSTP